MASRMESNSEAGRVNISETTHGLVLNDFTFTYRGKINAKNKGEVDMYFVDTEIKKP
jgi:class 3 adenylate cyclase